METLTFTQITENDIRDVIRTELENFFAQKGIGSPQVDVEKIGGIDLAVEITGLAKPTIYGLVHGRSIPHSKRGKKLYFSRQELTDWLKQGKRKTQAEVAVEAANYGQQTTKKEAFTPTKQMKRFPKV